MKPTPHIEMRSTSLPQHPAMAYLRPALGIVDYVRRRFARFKLCTHFLDLCSRFFHGCDETCHRRFQLLSLFVLFEKFIEQHRVDQFVADAFRLAFVVVECIKCFARCSQRLLENPVVLLERANAPLAVFEWPVSLLTSAPVPTATFSSPVVLRNNATGANCRVGIRGIEGQRSSPNAGVVTGGTS
jgi:hypothetical protein